MKNTSNAEREELRTYYEKLQGRAAELEGELNRLLNNMEEVAALTYARRALEVIVTEICEKELKRSRGSEPLEGILDRFNKEKIIPEYIIVSMRNLNRLGTFGAHPKPFTSQQVREAFIALTTTVDWYIVEYRKLPAVPLAAPPPPKPEPIPQSEPQSIAQSVHQTEPQPIPETLHQAGPEPTAEPAPKAESQPGPQPPPGVEPEPVPEPPPEAEPEPIPEPIPEPVPTGSRPSWYKYVFAGIPVLVLVIALGLFFSLHHGSGKVTPGPAGQAAHHKMASSNPSGGQPGTQTPTSKSAAPAAAKSKVVYHYAMVCLRNKTSVPITYSFRWGDSGKWQTREIPAGGSHWHSWKYDPGSRVSPPLQVKFDATLNGGDMKTYVLKRYAAASQACGLGKTYDFVPVGNLVGLKSEN